ncbi:MAG: sortase, partial [Patescibacteria group bacterium]
MDKVLTRQTGLFIGTFVSALLLVWGLGMMGSVLVPIAITKLSGPIRYQPLLPISDIRDEEFIDIDSIPSKQFFPPLSNPERVTGGDQILIPAIDVQVPIVMSASIQDKDVIAALDSGAALYPNGILPGRLGNVFISAHSSGTVLQGAYRFAFTRIGELAPGSVIHVDYQGTRYTYKLTHNRIVKPDPNFHVLSDRPVPTLTVMACWPIWRTSKRMLWHGELANITKLSPN